VYEAGSQDEGALRARLGEAHERLEELVGDLRAIDDALEGLAVERQQFGVLEDVCGGLERLTELGAAGLFWGGGALDGRGEDHVRLVRGRVDAFRKRLDEIEIRRQDVVDEIERAQESAEFLEDDLFEVRRAAELRKLEWIPEREVDALPVRPSRMPWSRGGEEDRRFRKTLLASLLLSLLLGMVLPLIDLPVPEPWEELEVPDRLTRLITEERPLPPPPPVPQETKPAETQPEPTEELARQQSSPEPTPEEAPQPAAASKGILAFRERFSGLAENDPAARLGSNARIDDSGEAAVGRATRSMVATRAAGSSGGIDLAALSRNVGGGGGGGIERVEVARATSSIGSGGGTERPLSGGPGPSRTDEEIQIVFDRHKAALYRLYNRELRRDPTLQGQMLLRIRIEPDGRVSLCELQSTDMKAPQLVAQVVERVGTFDFGAKDGVPPVTILYPIDFLPAT
jgi:hypothetical protein